MADPRSILAADLQAALAAYRAQIEAAGLPWREPETIDAGGAKWGNLAVFLRLYSDGLVEMSWPHNGWGKWEPVAAWRALLDPWDHAETGDPASERPSPVNEALGSNRPERSDGNALSSVLDLPCHYCRQTTCQCLGKGALIAERDTLKAENETLRHDHEEELAFLWEEYAEADPAILTPKAAKFGARLRTIAGYDILSAANKQLQAENEKLRWAGETLLWTLRADGDDPETEWGCNCEDNDEYDAARGGRCPYCRLVAAELIEAGKTSGAPLVRVQVSRRLAQTLGIEGPALPTQIRSIAAAVLQCAEGWEPQARLIGNVTAAELVSFARAVLLAPTDDSGEPLSESLANLTEEQQVALATQACLAHNGDQVESYEDPLEDDEEETVEEMLERYREQDDEARSRRGTSECDGLCDPQCNWCLVGHSCPEDCGGGEECPYVALEAEEAARRADPGGSAPQSSSEHQDVIAASPASETPDLDPSNNPGGA